MNKPDYTDTLVRIGVIERLFQDHDWDDKFPVVATISHEPEFSVIRVQPLGLNLCCAGNVAELVDSIAAGNGKFAGILKDHDWSNVIGLVVGMINESTKIGNTNVMMTSLITDVHSSELKAPVRQFIGLDIWARLYLLVRLPDKEIQVPMEGKFSAGGPLIEKLREALIRIASRQPDGFECVTALAEMWIDNEKDTKARIEFLENRHTH